MALKFKSVVQIFLGVCTILFFCEYLIYYIVLYQCSWPNLSEMTVDKSIHVEVDEDPVRAMIISDTHLLGSRNGHWFDKLRREWQMHRAFQSAISLFAPHVVFILGDLFDEGLWCSEKEFQYYVKRFHSLFHVPKSIQMYVVVGNHDVGFHYGISPYLHERFSSAFNAPSVRMVTIRGNHFVLVNSMAMEGDGCFLCRQAELQLQRISKRLKCSKGIGKCEKGSKLQQYSRPILLQHFPMYRESDVICSEPDEAPDDMKMQKFQERWDCLSKESSENIFDSLRPRLIVTGHTHHGCHLVHRGEIHEWTLPSFSWRNKNNPSFMLATFTPNNYSVRKCYMPEETTVFVFYVFGSLFLLLWIIFAYPRLDLCRKICGRSRWFKAN